MSCGTQMFGINYSLLVHECHEKVFVVLREGVSGRRECHEKVLLVTGSATRRYVGLNVPGVLNTFFLKVMFCKSIYQPTVCAVSNFNAALKNRPFFTNTCLYQVVGLLFW